MPRVPRGLWWVLLFNAAVSLVLFSPTQHPRWHLLVDDIAGTLGPVLTGAWGFAAAWRNRACPSRTRLAALCLSLGTLCYGVGEGVWAYNEVILHHTDPFPSVSDVFFLSAYPFLVAGIFLLPGRALSRTARLIVGMDSMMVLTGLVVFSWYFVLGPTLLQGSESLLGKVLGAAYPVSDLALLACVVLLTARGGTRRSVAQMTGVGLTCIVIIDTLFAYQNLHGSYRSGGVQDVLWTLGYMLLAQAGTLACAPADIPRAVLPDTRLWRQFTPLVRALLPYVPVPAIALLILHTMRQQTIPMLDRGVYIGGALLLACVLVRQFLAVVENGRLAARLAEFNARLEDTVAARTAEISARTQQLSALLELTAAVHDAGEEEHIVDAAHFHTQAALRADTVQVFLLPGGCDADLFKDDPAAAGCAGAALCAPVQDGAALLGTIAAARHAPFDPDTDAALLRSIGAEVGRALGNARRLQEARDAADRDPVTGLFNHRAIHQRLDRELAGANAADVPLSLVMMDLDNFKLFNDTYGHPVGDEVLRRVAAALRDECGSDVQSARYGGDEFLLLLPGADGAAAHALARRLQTRLAHEVLQSEEMVSGEKRVIPVALSCGVAAFPADSVDRHELLSIADANLYAAKGSEDGVMGSSDAQRVNRTLRSEGGFGLLDAMLTAVDNKDRYTRRHSEDVTEYALWIADEIGLPGDEKKALRQGGLLHDVGKIGVPEDILRKPGRLTPDEYDILKRHAELGALIVGGVPGMEQVLDAVRHHHERWDGSGYPDNLAGTDIPLSGRILAIADAMSAMTTDRPYRRGMAWETAVNIVREGRGTQFDPALADAFLRADARRTSSASVLPKAA